MAFVTLEDMYGSMESVFPTVLSKYGAVGGRKPSVY